MKLLSLPKTAGEILHYTFLPHANYRHLHSRQAALQVTQYSHGRTLFHSGKQQMHRQNLYEELAV